MEVPVLHDRPQDHAHSLFYVYRSMDRDHAPFTLAVCLSKKGSEKGCAHRGFDRLLD